MGSNLSSGNQCYIHETFSTNDAWPYDWSDCSTFIPKTKEELQTAVGLWISDKTAALSTYGGEINTWDVSLITDMMSMFKGKTTFNDDISGWDVSNVTDMSSLFRGTDNFNGDISNWDVSSVNNMYGIFWDAASFNQNISSWDVSKVAYMSKMFDGANALSDVNKGLIHTALSSNANWPYGDWSSFVVDEAPTAIALTNDVTSLAEDADTTSSTKIADIVITDADGGTNTVALSGADAASFEVVGSELQLKAGVAFDYETKTSYAVTLTTGSVSVDHTLTITDIDEGPTAIALSGAVTSLAEDAGTSGATKMGDIVITDADGGTNAVSLSGADAASFEVVGSELLLKAGVTLDYETKSSYAVTLTTGSAHVSHTLAIADVDESGSYTSVKGDVNNDGVFNGADVVFLASWVASLQTQVDEANADPKFVLKADVNGDGQTNGADVVYMASSVAGLPSFVISGNIADAASASHAAAASVQQVEPLRAILATAAVRQVALPRPAAYTHPLGDTGSSDTIEIVDIFEGL